MGMAGPGRTAALLGAWREGDESAREELFDLLYPWLRQAAAGAINGFGNAASNRIVGNDGANRLNGAAGADLLIGGGGNDVYVVDNAGDQVIEDSAAGGVDLVRSTADFILGANVENLRFMGSGHLAGTGNELGNEITGNFGDNLLRGEGGDDRLSGSVGSDDLHGGDGMDVLHGGQDADDFHFDTALGGGNVDTILDMSSGEDRIMLDDAVFAGLALGTLSADAFTTGTAATTAEHRIIYDAATGALWFDADGNGDGAAVQFATIANPAILQASDFVVI